MLAPCRSDPVENQSFFAKSKILQKAVKRVPHDHKLCRLACSETNSSLSCIAYKKSLRIILNIIRCFLNSVEGKLENKEYYRCSDAVNEKIEAYFKRLTIGLCAIVISFALALGLIYEELNNQMKFKYVSIIKILEQVHDVSIENSIVQKRK